MSVHLVKVGRRQVVVCSDGQGTNDTGSVGTDYEKLFRTGERSFCGIVGALSLDRAGTDLIAPRITKLCSVDALLDSPRKFLSALRDDLHQSFIKLFATDADAFKWYLDDTKIVFEAFSLMRERTGEITLLELQFPLENDAGTPRLGEPKIITTMEGEMPRGVFCFALGPEYVQRNPLMPLNPDSGDDAILAMVDPMIDSFKRNDAMCRNEIGGVIEVAAIDADGFRWLRRDETKARPTETKRPPLWRRALAAFQ